MTPCLVFNHHSLPFESSEHADTALPDFLKLLLKAQNIGFATILVEESVDREFWLPEGRKELFHYHVKLNNEFRLHFFPDSSSNIIFIGYIGPHLKLK